MADKNQLNNALIVSTNQKPAAMNEIKGLEGITSIQLAAIANLLSNKTDKTGKGGDRRALTCEHCKKKGHDKESCWQLHPERIPDWVKEKEAARKNNKFTKSFSVAEATELLAKAKEAEKKSNEKTSDKGVLVQLSRLFRQTRKR